MKKIYIVLINFNSQENTVDCLNSLSKIKTSGFKLSTIVINNSPERKLKVNEGDYKKIDLKIIYSQENVGFAGGMNIGIDTAMENNADYVLIHNNDTYVKDDFLEKLFDFLERNKNVGIVSPKIYFAKGYEFHKDRYKSNELGKVIWYAGGKIDWNNVIGHNMGVDEVDYGEFNKDLEMDFATGCSMLIRTDLIKKVGKFNEKYFLYYEDADLSVRAKKSGFKVCFVSSSVVWHKNAGSAGGSGSQLQDYYITRNRLYFGHKYAPVRAKIALAKEGLLLMTKGRVGQRWGASDYFKRKMGKSGRF